MTAEHAPSGCCSELSSQGMFLVLAREAPPSKKGLLALDMLDYQPHPWWHGLSHGICDVSRRNHRSPKREGKPPPVVRKSLSTGIAPTSR